MSIPVKRHPLPPQTRERLLNMAKLLDIVPEQSFDMKTWKCGTSACAMGWAVDLGFLPELGLCDDFPGSGFLCLYRKRIGIFDGTTTHTMIREALPGLYFDDIRKLFYRGMKATAVQKARQIREVASEYP